MPNQPTRRTFFLQMGAAATTLPVGLRAMRRNSPNEKLQIAGIGCGGKGWSDIGQTSKDQAVVALCDVDRNRLAKAKERWTNAKTYTDWRRLLEQQGIDAVTVSTPDHMHAPIAMAAMALGKHVYVQKPLTHCVFEARQLLRMAQKQGVVTQMGNQHRSTRNYRGARDLVQTGVIGQVREVHSWTNRPIWPQGMDRPAGSDPVPDWLEWDLWLGVAPERPYKKDVYHPFRWRGFWDFGTGALGDMGCHLMDPAVWSLDLGLPTKVEALGPKPHPDTAPTWSITAYDFPARGTMPPVRMYWYDGGAMPPAEIVKWPQDQQVRPNGCLFVGEKGNLYVDGGFGPLLLPEQDWQDFEMPEFPHTDHYMNWTNACKGEGACISPFEEAAPLTEAVLLGNVAYRLGVPVHWNKDEMAVENARVAAEPLIRPTYRRGWETDWVE